MPSRRLFISTHYTAFLVEHSLYFVNGYYTFPMQDLICWALLLMSLLLYYYIALHTKYIFLKYLYIFTVHAIDACKGALLLFLPIHIH